MDNKKAQLLLSEIKGTIINGFKVLELVNNGKSAAVFKAEKGSSLFALKIFDSELIERFGDEIQIKRITQEISLKGHAIDNLVKIYEGGKACLNEQNYYYIIMEYIEGINLKQYIQTRDYNQDFIITVLSKLNYVTEQLLTRRQIAHRDIKPENIMVRNNGAIVLMDLGVLKLVGTKSFSDADEKVFVGTLRYAPPEFLFRNEEDSIEGWRGVNYYQIGATLHDLIMRKELFHDQEPFTNLVSAIEKQIPKISNSHLSHELVQLTRDLLTKEFKKRIQLVSSKRIARVASIKDKSDNLFTKSLDKILELQIDYNLSFNELEKAKADIQAIAQRKKEFSESLFIAINNCMDSINAKGICLSLLKYIPFQFPSEESEQQMITYNYLFELCGNLRLGYLRNLVVLINVSNNEKHFTEIKIMGMFPTTWKGRDTQKPIGVFEVTEYEQVTRSIMEFKTITIFQGTLNTIDESFLENIKTKIMELIEKSLRTVKQKVEDEIAWQKTALNYNRGSFIKFVMQSGHFIKKSMQNAKNILIENID